MNCPSSSNLSGHETIVATKNPSSSNQPARITETPTCTGTQEMSVLCGKLKYDGSTFTEVVHRQDNTSITTSDRSSPVYWKDSGSTPVVTELSSSRTSAGEEESPSSLAETLINSPIHALARANRSQGHQCLHYRPREYIDYAAVTCSQAKSRASKSRGRVPSAFPVVRCLRSPQTALNIDGALKL